MALKPAGETDVKNLVPKFNAKYKLKANFFLLGTPDEVLKCLVDLKLRKMWDYNILNIAKHPTNNSMKVTYKSKDASLPDYFEEISFSYFQNEQIFYIIESINSPTLSKSERVWTFEQVVNRPYLMRVTMHWTVTPQYHRVKGQGTFIIKGLAGLKNYIQ